MKQSKQRERLSIIIPVLNEEGYIGKLLDYLIANCSDITREIIVVDGGSVDRTVELAENRGVKVLRSEKGRALQMNVGAKEASADILYFLHVDTYPPAVFENAIIDAVQNGYPAGCFRMKFDTDSRFLNFFAWFSKINHRLCRGGDQSLFIKRKLFDKLDGFDESFKVYEDTEFICRIYRTDKFKVLPYTVLTSARRYNQIGNVRLQFHFGVIHLKRILGAGPEKLHNYYQRHIATS